MEVGARPLIAGILNVTPDSFSDGGSYFEADRAIAHGMRLLEDGADLLDLGGESTRPGSSPVPPEEQERRILPVLHGLRERTDAPISIDTQDPGVLAAALAAGADILNDVSGCGNPGMRQVLRDRPVPVILMHMQGTPIDMQVRPDYPRGVVATVLEFFTERLRVLASWGVEASRTILDPGIGFGKRLQHNWELVRNIQVFLPLGRPIYIGASRKGFIQKSLAGDGVGSVGLEDIDLGTLIVNGLALDRGCHILRVHNVRHARALVRLREALLGTAERCGEKGA